MMDSNLLNASEQVIGDAPALLKLLEIGKNIIAEQEIDQVLTIAIDHAIQITGAERGTIILFDDNGKNLFEAPRNFGKEDIPDFEISRTIINKVKSEGKPICLRNALKNPELKKIDSFKGLKILSVICLPLYHDSKIFGTMYLDSRTVRRAFTVETCSLAQIFEDFISIAAYHALERRRLQNHQQALEDELRGQYDFQAIIGHSRKMLEVLQMVSQVALTDATVLIEGESGTGKELIAQAIHNNSARKNLPLVSMNCSAIPESLLESELFGHEKGAFTGAFKRRKGKFEQANASTIFLDEVDEMSPAMQVKLLRVIQYGEYAPLGSEATQHCDVRILAAAKCDLKNLVEQGKFRGDLYYRLRIIRVQVPPLRERKEDILLLAEYFLQKYCRRLIKPTPVLSPAAQHALRRYDFPGNVRELENMLHHVAILCRENTVELAHLPPELRQQRHSKGADEHDDLSLSFQQAKQRVIEKFEREYLRRVLDECGGVILKAAEKAGMHEKNFHEKLAKYGIRPSK